MKPRLKSNNDSEQFTFDEQDPDPLLGPREDQDESLQHMTAAQVYR